MKDSNKTNGSDADPRPERTKPPCKLVGQEGNVFNLIGLVRQALIKAGQEDAAKEFVQRAFKARSYHEVLSLCLHYVDVH